MLAVEVEFLTGRYVAARHDDRNAPEWPPHPARLFSAMVAAWGSVAEPSSDEEAALRELETLEPPLISAPQALVRTPVTHYVPVNDPSIIGAALWGRVAKAEQAHQALLQPDLGQRERKTAEKQLAKARDVSALVGASAAGSTSSSLPEHRGKQARSFPSVTINLGLDIRATVTYLWPQANVSPHVHVALDALLMRVTRLGHSSSLVNCRILNEPWPEATYWPQLGGPDVLRTVGEGQFDALVYGHRQHQASKPRSMPHEPAAYATSAPPESIPASGLAGSWYSFELKPRLGVRALESLTSAVRSRLTIDNGASPDQTPNFYVLGLPHVGHRHASGDLLGFAIVLPDTISPTDRKTVLSAVGHQLPDGTPLNVGGTSVTVRRQVDDTIKALTIRRWQAPAREWVSATPIVLAASPARSLDAASYDEWVARWLAESCVRIGLPSPISVGVSAQPLIAGARPTRMHSRVKQAGRVRRLLHAAIEFDRPVAGPILLGGGKNQGFGLMAPVEGTHV